MVCMRFFVFLSIFFSLSKENLWGENYYNNNCNNENYYKVSVVCSGRNDDYGGNFLDRLEYFLRSIDRLTVPAEIILVEWNPIPNKPKLSEIIKIWNDRLKYSNPIVIVEVSKENHDLFCSYYKQADSKYTFQEYPAKNVGFRHARGKYIIQTNPDNFYCTNTLKHIQEIVNEDTNDISVGSPVRVDLQPILNFKSLINITDESVVNEYLELLDAHCQGNRNGHTTPLGDFMLFKRELALKSKGFPEFPSGIHHFEMPFVEAFLNANHGSQLRRLDGLTVYHFDHSRWGGGGLSQSDGYRLLKQSASKSSLLGCPSPAPVNDENWGLANQKLKKTIIEN